MNTILTIDISNSKIVSTIAKNDITDKTEILGVGIEKKVRGIEKGNITNLEAAASCIKKSVDAARSYAEDVEIDKVYATISGSFTKNIKAVGTVNVPSNQITEKEINVVMQKALTNANIPADYDLIHAIALGFKVDENQNIENPLNIIGSRLEVNINAIIAKKSYLNNLKTAVKHSGFDIDVFVLNSYASTNAIAQTLDDDKKANGYLVIDIGSTSTGFAILKGKSIIFSDFLPIGSENITKDLSIMLNTSKESAENVKQKYGTLLASSHTQDKIRFTKSTEENVSIETSMEYIISIIHARLEELFILIREKIETKGLSHSFKSGIILTGGACNTRGINELCSKIFVGNVVRISSPQNLKNNFLNFEEPIYASTVGLVKYAFEITNPYELDSRKMIRIKERKAYPKPQQHKEMPAQRVEPRPQPLSDTKIIEKPKTKNGLFAQIKKIIEGHL